MLLGGRKPVTRSVAMQDMDVLTRNAGRWRWGIEWVTVVVARELLLLYTRSMTM